MKNIDIVRDVSANVKKPSKAYVFDIFCEMVENLPVYEVERNEKLLGHLYRSFLPKIGKVIHDDLLWVGQAVDKDHYQCTLRFTHVHDRSIIASDGARMYSAINKTGLKNGIYCNKTGGRIADEDVLTAEKLIKCLNECVTKGNTIDIAADQVVASEIINGKPLVRIGEYKYDFKFCDAAMKTKSKLVKSYGYSPLVLQFECGRIAAIMPIKL